MERDLIVRMAYQLDRLHQLLRDDRTARHPLAAEARAFLAAEPQGEGLSDQELYDLADEHNGEPVASMRAALARWGRPAAPPAEGEVAELVAALQSEATNCTCSMVTSGDLRRIAALLQQRHPQAVPVSERLPDPRPESEGGDCDAEGKCWMFSKIEPEWRLISAVNPGIPRLHYCFSHWLFFSALPLPTTTTESMADLSPAAQAVLNAAAGGVVADRRAFPLLCHEIANRGFSTEARRCRRAAALLQQQHPEPVLVSERLPTEDELTQYLFEGFRGPIEFLCDAEEEAHLMIRSHVKFARAALNRWGRPAARSAARWKPVPVSEWLTVQEINDLPEHRENYIYASGSDKIQLDGDFTRAQLLQLANSTYAPCNNGALPLPATTQETNDD